MVFQRSLSDNKCPLVSRTLLGILADLNHAVFRIVLVFLLISNTSSLSSKPFGIDPSPPIKIGMTVILMFHGFCLVLWKVQSIYLFFSLLLFSFWDQSEWKNPLYDKLSFIFLFFFLCYLTLGLFFWPGLGDSFVSKSRRELLKCFLIGLYSNFSFS